MNTDTAEAAMFQTWEFKGVEIKPLSIGRKNNLITLARSVPAGPTMFAMVLYGATCKPSEIIRGLRDPDWFIEKVTEWMEKIEMDQDDYEELGRIFNELIASTNKNRAVPVSDPDMMPDPLGNG